MQYVRWLNELGTSDKSWAGEKTAGLGELVRAGLDVPRGFCVGAQAYVDSLAAHGLSGKIAARLGSIDVGDPTQLEPAAEEIREWIEHVSLSGEIEREVQAALTGLDAKSYAVRASRVLTDVPDAASSGLKQAHLAILEAGLLDSIRQIWATPWNSRAIYFRHRKKIPHADVSMAVIVQEMVEADAGGVLFTSSPSGGGADEIHIDGVWGSGEAVNAARWKPDHFVIDKASGAIREKTIATKTVMQVVADDGGLQTIGVPEEKQMSASLTDAQVAALVEIGKKAEAHFHAAQDMAWCRVRDRFFLLQTRGIAKK